LERRRTAAVLLIFNMNDMLNVNRKTGGSGFPHPYAVKQVAQQTPALAIH